MKKSFVLIMVTIVLSILSDIKAQSNNITYAETNPFLVSKRHGAFVIVNYNSSINPSDMVYDRNPFLVEKRHGAVVYLNANALLGTSNPAVEQNLFLRQKRHQ